MRCWCGGVGEGPSTHPSTLQEGLSFPSGSADLTPGCEGTHLQGSTWANERPPAPVSLLHLNNPVPIRNALSSWDTAQCPTKSKLPSRSLFLFALYVHYHTGGSQKASELTASLLFPFHRGRHRGSEWGDQSTHRRALLRDRLSCAPIFIDSALGPIAFAKCQPWGEKPRDPLAVIDFYAEFISQTLPRGQLKGKDGSERGEDGEIGLKVWAVPEVSFCGVLGQNSMMQQVPERPVLGCRGDHSVRCRRLPLNPVSLTCHHGDAQKKRSRGGKIVSHPKREGSQYTHERAGPVCKAGGLFMDSLRVPWSF